MQTRFVSQPIAPLWREIARLVEEQGAPSEMIVASAFASLAAVFRLEELFGRVRANGGLARLIVGVDLGGTSRQVLARAATWDAEVFVMKNRGGGVVFHPKIYLLRWIDAAVIVVGSNNLTDAGLFSNYEAASVTWFSLPREQAELEEARQQLSSFLDPAGATSRRLDAAYLEMLLRHPGIPSESRSGGGEEDRRRHALAGGAHDDIFGWEAPAGRDPLPGDYLKVVIEARRDEIAGERRRHRRALNDGVLPPPERNLGAAMPLAPNAFYMTLPAVAGINDNIPGEMRIPLIARDIAPGMWGWPGRYAIKPATRGTYNEWYSDWLVSEAGSTAAPETHRARLYLYEESSDFRLHIGRVRQMGASDGDIVRIRRIDLADATFELVLAKAGTPAFREWEQKLTEIVSNSPRRWGYD